MTLCIDCGCVRQGLQTALQSLEQDLCARFTCPREHHAILLLVDGDGVVTSDVVQCGRGGGRGVHRQ